VSIEQQSDIAKLISILSIVSAKLFNAGNTLNYYK